MRSLMRGLDDDAMCFWFFICVGAVLVTSYVRWWMG